MMFMGFISKGINQRLLVGRMGVLMIGFDEPLRGTILIDSTNLINETVLI